jgi:hypothetical protein
MIHTYIHAHIHIYIHTYIHTYIQSKPQIQTTGSIYFPYCTDPQGARLCVLKLLLEHHECIIVKKPTASSALTGQSSSGQLSAGQSSGTVGQMFTGQMFTGQNTVTVGQCFTGQTLTGNSTVTVGQFVTGQTSVGMTGMSMDQSCYAGNVQGDNEEAQSEAKYAQWIGKTITFTMGQVVVASIRIPGSAATRSASTPVKSASRSAYSPGNQGQTTSPEYEVKRGKRKYDEECETHDSEDVVRVSTPKKRDVNGRFVPFEIVNASEQEPEPGETQLTTNTHVSSSSSASKLLLGDTELLGNTYTSSSSSASKLLLCDNDSELFGNTHTSSSSSASKLLIGDHDFELFGNTPIRPAQLTTNTRHHQDDVDLSVLLSPILQSSQNSPFPALLKTSTTWKENKSADAFSTSSSLASPALARPKAAPNVQNASDVSSSSSSSTFWASPAVGRPRTVPKEQHTSDVSSSSSSALPVSQQAAPRTSAMPKQQQRKHTDDVSSCTSSSALREEQPWTFALPHEEDTPVYKKTKRSLSPFKSRRSPSSSVCSSVCSSPLASKLSTNIARQTQVQNSFSSASSSNNSMILGGESSVSDAQRVLFGTLEEEESQEVQDEQQPCALVQVSSTSFDLGGIRINFSAHKLSPASVDAPIMQAETRPEMNRVRTAGSSPERADAPMHAAAATETRPDMHEVSAPRVSSASAHALKRATTTTESVSSDWDTHTVVAQSSRGISMQRVVETETDSSIHLVCPDMTVHYSNVDVNDQNKDENDHTGDTPMDESLDEIDLFGDAHMREQASADIQKQKHGAVDGHIREHGVVDSHARGNPAVDVNTREPGSVDSRAREHGVVDSHARGNAAVDVNTSEHGSVDSHVREREVADGSLSSSSASSCKLTSSPSILLTPDPSFVATEHKDPSSTSSRVILAPSARSLIHSRDAQGIHSDCADSTEAHCVRTHHEKEAACLLEGQNRGRHPEAHNTTSAKSSTENGAKKVLFTREMLHEMEGTTEDVAQPACASMSSNISPPGDFHTQSLRSSTSPSGALMHNDVAQQSSRASVASNASASTSPSALLPEDFIKQLSRVLPAASNTVLPNVSYADSLGVSMHASPNGDETATAGTARVLGRKTSRSCTSPSEDSTTVGTERLVGTKASRSSASPSEDETMAGAERVVVTKTLRSSASPSEESTMAGAERVVVTKTSRSSSVLDAVSSPNEDSTMAGAEAVAGRKTSHSSASSNEEVMTVGTERVVGRKTSRSSSVLDAVVDDPEKLLCKKSKKV